MAVLFPSLKPFTIDNSRTLQGPFRGKDHSHYGAHIGAHECRAYMLQGGVLHYAFLVERIAHTNPYGKNWWTGSLTLWKRARTGGRDHSHLHVLSLSAAILAREYCILLLSRSDIYISQFGRSYWA